jgi:hypothetical protein
MPNAANHTQLGQVTPSHAKWRVITSVTLVNPTLWMLSTFGQNKQIHKDAQFRRVLTPFLSVVSEIIYTELTVSIIPIESSSN